MPLTRTLTFPPASGPLRAGVFHPLIERRRACETQQVQRRAGHRGPQGERGRREGRRLVPPARDPARDLPRLAEDGRWIGRLGGEAPARSRGRERQAEADRRRSDARDVGDDRAILGKKTVDAQGKAPSRGLPDGRSRSGRRGGVAGSSTSRSRARDWHDVSTSRPPSRASRARSCSTVRRGDIILNVPRLCI